ncbi:CLUMA_CG004446, isoform A [Clunio marinus]|uniref:CLUMA_CG004446, isoform A n=1 Tax=Clunio marinus TaxID=568069 RepID=A0A1J1HT69_9DIPT|nr:CLUMA_CG004446, isoform A [Clunio marinus]
MKTFELKTSLQVKLRRKQKFAYLLETSNGLLKNSFMTSGKSKSTLAPLFTINTSFPRVFSCLLAAVVVVDR